MGTDELHPASWDEGCSSPLETRFSSTLCYSTEFGRSKPNCMGVGRVQKTGGR